MAENDDRLKFLLQRYADNLATEVEIREMLNGLQLPGGDAELESFVLKLKDEANDKHAGLADREKMWTNIIEGTKPQGLLRKIKLYRAVAAAAILIVLSGVGYWMFSKNDSAQGIAEKISNDVEAPVNNNALLTLSNGKTIVLDSAGSRQLAMEAGARVVKLADGEIKYNVTGEPGEEQYNILTVPGEAGLRILFCRMELRFG